MTRDRDGPILRHAVALALHAGSSAEPATRELMDQLDRLLRGWDCAVDHPLYGIGVAARRAVAAGMLANGIDRDHALHDLRGALRRYLADRCARDYRAWAQVRG